MNKFKRIANLCFCLFLFTTSLSFALPQDDTKNESIIQEKYYIESHQVHIGQTGIFLEMKEGMSKVDGVFADVDGVYVTHLPDPQVHRLDWVCPRCGYLNHFYHNTCHNPSCPTKRR